MQLKKTYIPYGGYWSTPFVKWQGSFANLHPIKFAGEVASRALMEREIEPSKFDALHLGTTVPSQGAFYGAPWLAGLIGAEGISGPTIGQACATSARVVGGAAFEIEAGSTQTVLAITADRTSNGPHMFYPNPQNPGARGDTEDWVWDNFNCDPWADLSMLETAENVAREEEITPQQQNEVVLLRQAQYKDALADEAAFQKRYMISPLDIKDARGRKVLANVNSDEGVFPTTRESLERLKPVMPEGSVTYGGQTYPADGNAGLILSTRAGAQALSRDRAIEVQVLAYGQARAKKGFMPLAPVPGTRAALAAAGLAIDDLAAIKTHNPFAVNDVYFSREMGVQLDAMNNYGCSLIWGHPQGPTGMRLIIELIEELVILGGGYGLFVGCAAGDTAAAVIVKVSDAN